MLIEVKTIEPDVFILFEFHVVKHYIMIWTVLLVIPIMQSIIWLQFNKYHDIPIEHSSNSLLLKHRIQFPPAQ